MPAPFHQIVAVIYVLRRLVICTSLAPILTIGLPITLRLLYKILSLFVGGDDRSVFLVAALAAFLSGLALYCLPLIVSNEAATAKAVAVKSKSKESQRSGGTKGEIVKENSDAAPQAKSTRSMVRVGVPIHRIWARVLLACFILSIQIVRWWERSFLLQLVRNLLPNSALLLQLPSFSTSLRISFSMLVLGCMVAARFFGPTSIVRFSTFPLVSNPWDATFQHFIQSVWNSLLLDLRGPVPPVTSPQLPQPSPIEEIEAHIGRRFQRPTLYSTAQHILLALMSSVLVAYVVVFPLSNVNVDHESERLFLRSVHLTSSILTTLGSLLSILDGVSHEINPYLLLEPTDHKWYSNLCRSLARSVIYTAVVVPIFAISLTKFVLPSSDFQSSSKDLLQLHVQLTTNCIIIAFYLTSMDEMLRTSLFHPRPNLTKMVNELSDETPEVTLLGVMLHSLLCDTTLVQQVAHFSVPNGINSPERDELKRSEELTKKMAHVYLTPRKENTPSEAPLEEDVLRFLLLELLGGGCLESERHQRMIHAWIDRPVPRRQSSNLQEPLSCLLVRGLCTFIGGAGEALMLCSQSSDPRTWKLSPSFFCSLELAIEAVKRCLERSLKPDGKRILCDWKSSHLSTQVPSTLNSLHKLRRGVVRYNIRTVQSENNLRQAEGNVGTQIPLSKPYGKLVQKCDMSALSILQSMKSLKGLGRVDLAINDQECLEWKNLLLARNEAS